ncbi:glycosyltransferase family 39 protein [Cellulomonas palmilytica]|uniref:glycosyltransferase family 39 protein n=1 Tax=Cellulomonas palmilytica TaxID=2608402 RepID=UPI001F43CBDB|nr:glycosyltransferase family 39 protein [Cellulomonas palmilytica]UJP39995.1 glycosyltransferase family 39 protein [Cellulomonas palmilytica]
MAGEDGPRATSGRGPGAARGARPAPAWGAVLAVAGGLVVVLLALAGRYGAHRDELYFVAAGHRPAWGYPDQPPLTPLLARLADEVAPGSVWALHVVPALVVGLLVVVAALTARELGGGRVEQVVTAVLVATGVVTLISGHMLSTTTTDTLFWALVVWLTLRTLRRDDPRGWVVVGLVAGVGLENKHLVAFLLVALAAGVLVVRETRYHARCGWAWLGAAVAVALWVPNLVWQARHGWPQLELAADIRDEYLTLGGRLEFVGLSLVLLNPVVTVVWVVGLVRLLRERSWAWARPVAWAYLGLVGLFLLTGGKAYYLAGLYPALVAAGVCALAATREPRRTARLAVIGALASLVALPAALPALPERTFADSPWAALGEDQAEMAGWGAFTQRVATLVDEHDAGLVLAGNYGEAGALEHARVLPDDVRVASGHNGFADWGPPPDDERAVVLTGYPVAPVWLRGCERLPGVDSGVDNEEAQYPVFVCAGPTEPWARLWPQVRRLAA